jgi:hypothetical protein
MMIMDCFVICSPAPGRAGLAIYILVGGPVYQWLPGLPIVR